MTAYSWNSGIVLLENWYRFQKKGSFSSMKKIDYNCVKCQDDVIFNGLYAIGEMTEPLGIYLKLFGIHGIKSF